MKRKTPIAVAALVLGVAGSALLGGTAIAGGHHHGGTDANANSDANSDVRCPGVNGDDGGIYTGDNICFLNDSANSTSGSGARY